VKGLGLVKGKPPETSCQLAGYRSYKEDIGGEWREKHPITERQVLWALPTFG
jgi:hypothetical protein